MTSTGLHLVVDKPLSIKKPTRLHFDLEINPFNGRKILVVEYQSISDIHWASHFSKAKRTSAVLRDIKPRRRDIVGDGIGGEEMTAKETEHLGPYHRQGMAILIEDGETGLVKTTVYKGNHEIDSDRYWKKPWTIYGVDFRREGSYVDPKGRIFAVEHGDKYDNEFATDNYSLGNFYHHLGSKVDQYLQDVFKDETISIANWCKHRIKDYINNWMGVLKVMEKAIDEDPHVDGNISGHSHMKGFHLTPGGKLCINDGSCTDHVPQSAICDKFGNWGVVDHFHDRMEIEMEDGHRYTEYYEDIGLDKSREPVELVENEYTEKTDRLLRIFRRLWPAKDLQTISRRIEATLNLVERLETALADRSDTLNPPQLYWALHQTQADLFTLDERRAHNPYPIKRPKKPESPAHDLALAIRKPMPVSHGLALVG